MATVSKWTPFGVALNITATGGTVTRTSATQFTVKINASWETYWSSSKTDYGMTASSGGGSVTLNKEGTKSAGSSGSFTGTYSISGNGSATKTITVTFKNFNTYHGDSATKSVSFNVSVPAWTSYKVTYYPNGGSGTTYTQTKWKDQSLTIATLATTKFARTGYSFLGWSTSSTATSPNGSYDPGDKYTGNANLKLYAVWKANTYEVTYNANDNANGSDVSNLPSAQTKTYDKPLTLSSTVPKRTNYTFKGWGTSASTTTVAYKPGESYTANAGITLYAIWELAYKKPTITSVSVYRCNGSATADENGTFAHVEFNWTCFLEDPTITIAWKTASGSGSSDVHNATGTSGTMSTTVGNDALTTESTYTFQITVADSNGSTTVSKILSGTKFAIDFLAGASGAAIGKPAELKDVFDIGFQTRLHGGLLYPVLEPCDINEVRTPNIYAGRNVSDYTYTCGVDENGDSISMPFDNGTFTLEVMSGGPNGQTWQRITVCSKTEPHAYERWYYTNVWGNWIAKPHYIWKTADLSASGRFTNYYSSGSEAPKYRRVGSTVDIRGTVKPTSDIEYSDEYATIFTLPAGYRPDTSVFTLCQGTGNSTWLLRVANTGEVGLARYRNGNTSATATTGVWLPFHCTFLVD